jgi:phage tail-like protein
MTPQRRRDDWLLHQLPVGMVEDDFLARFLRIFQTVADTELHQIDTLRHMFDPSVAPDPMVRLMGEWIGINWVDSSLPDELQRRIVREYSELVQWRGTARGLRQLLELISLSPAVVQDSGGVYADGEAPPNAPHVRLYVERSGWATENDLLRIVRAELPASMTFELHVGARQIWPPQPDGGGSADEPILVEVS